MQTRGPSPPLRACGGICSRRQPRRRPWVHPVHAGSPGHPPRPRVVEAVSPFPPDASIETGPGSARVFGRQVPAVVCSGAAAHPPPGPRPFARACGSPRPAAWPLLTSDLLLVAVDDLVRLLDAAHDASARPPRGDRCASTGNLAGEPRESWPRRRSTETCQAGAARQQWPDPARAREYWPNRVTPDEGLPSCRAHARRQLARPEGVGHGKPGPVGQIRKLPEPRRGTAPASARREWRRNSRSRINGHRKEVIA